MSSLFSQAVINLMNLINSFPSLYQVLQQSPTVSFTTDATSSSPPPTTLLVSALQNLVTAIIEYKLMCAHVCVHVSK